MARFCGVCGAAAAAMFRAPPAELAPDLDLRPGEPTRSTLPRWVATCQGCNAAAPDLATLPAPLRSVVDSTAYRELADTHPLYALPFIRWAALLAASGESAAEAWLQAAWTADDTGDTALAVAWRRQTAASWGEVQDVSAGLRLVDVLRRAGDFAAAAAAVERLTALGLDETSAKIMAFQRICIAAGDSGRQSIGSALRPPASKPHVAHVQPRTPARRSSFWSKLFNA